MGADGPQPRSPCPKLHIGKFQVLGFLSSLSLSTYSKKVCATILDGWLAYVKSQGWYFGGNVP